jgi:hypothetical protein
MKLVTMTKAARVVSDLRKAFNILARAIDAVATLKSAARAMAVMRAKLFMAGSSPRFFLEPLGRRLASRA